jgi:Flp pilus assembly protein TadD
MPELSKPANPLPKLQAEAIAHPNDADVQAGLGWALYGQRQFAEAIQAFEGALKLNGDHLEANYGLGMAHKMVGSTGLAVKSFEIAAALAAKIDDHDRHKMLSKLIGGQLSDLQTGDWNLSGKK